MLIFAALVVAAGVLRVSYGYFLSEEVSKAQGRLSLYESSMAAELERFTHLTYVLAHDPFVIGTAAGGSVDALNQRFANFATQAELGAIYLMRTDGLTIAASNYGDATSFVGQNYAFRPYFQDAMDDTQGRFYAIGATSGLPGYFIANAVRDASERTIGVVAIKIDFTQLETSWRNSGEQVLLANEDGVVLLASDPAWRFAALAPLSGDQRARIEGAQQFPAQPLAPLDWSDLPDQRARIAGAERIHLTASDLPHGWALHYFATDDRAVARSWLVTVLAALVAGFAVVMYQLQKARRVGAALAHSEKEEAELRIANERLAVEIEERRTAERRLKRTQTELERAGRLAALGKLSASVTHELGQPIAAMRNHLVAAEMTADAPAALTRKIGGLVDRMDGITKQLKFFARGEPQVFGAFDLRDAIGAAVGLVAPNIESLGAAVQVNLPPAPVMIRGNRLRIEQMLTNVLRNALDATEGVSAPEIAVVATCGDTMVTVTIRDNGHGLGAATLAELQEPFFTTQESGRGMGLGLAISMGIVEDHGGAMTARNARGDGAVFEVTLPLMEGDADA